MREDETVDQASQKSEWRRDQAAGRQNDPHKEEPLVHLQEFRTRWREVSKQQFQLAIRETYQPAEVAGGLCELERLRPRAREKVRKAPAGPCNAGPVRVTREKWRAISSPRTWPAFKVPSSSSFEMAQRETNPTPSPASTADLMDSVESRSITRRNDLSLRPDFLSAVSTTRRDPEPCSRMSRFEARSFCAENCVESECGGTISTNSSRMKGSVCTPL